MIRGISQVTVREHLGQSRVDKGYLSDCLNIITWEHGQIYRQANRVTLGYLGETTLISWNLAASEYIRLLSGLESVELLAISYFRINSGG